MTYKSFYTSVELAKLLGISRQAVWNNRVKFKGVKQGRDWLYPKKQFELYFKIVGKETERRELKGLSAIKEITL